MAQTLAQSGSYAFIFAHDVAGAVAIANSMQPDLVVLALDSLDGIAACEQLRNIPETRALRILLVIKNTELSRARTAGASGILLQPASAVLIALEVKRVLERPERRSVWLPDRRKVFRGGRRTTDIAAG